jgi:hypothetical protein
VSRKQWGVVIIILLITAFTLSAMARSVIRSLNQLEAAPVASTSASTAQPTTTTVPISPPLFTSAATFNSPLAHNPTKPPRPTYTPTPTRTPTPRPFWSLPTLTPAANFAPTAPSGQRYATLDDFWKGKAKWAIQAYDVGLPVGESDTVYVRGEFWAYLNASHQSAGIRDQCGDPVPFPGCVTLWKSRDGGYRFYLDRPVCLFPCKTCPCGPGDHVDQQQYPRITFSQGRFVMVYEWGAGAFVRTSYNGVDWSGESQVTGTGIWRESEKPCGSEAETIGLHPHVSPGLAFDCLAGAPPGIYIEDKQLYVFVGLGRAPSHMGCFVGDMFAPVEEMRPCTHNPLFAGAREYGPLDALGAEANDYFDFRTISSADVVKMGEHYYMTYEGTRGPSRDGYRDDQFGLGFARSISSTIDGPWQTYPGNPVLVGVGDHWGIGHADMLIVNNGVYLYTSTSPTTRGRYVLVYK